ncbi:MAG TPA: carbohydrate kinase [Caldithrix abyssi]|uniref:Carbohydrate kinase n=1 Tax=Caldithrix abyssi TaxID=187145 RepID=A0A7V4TYA3_CALAY|nr:carbohydrate kinase [Caldithrix abyssi]
MSDDLLLAVDCGTQSVRALLFDPRGTLIDREQIPIEPYFSTAPGLAEQDVQVFWKALCQATRKILAREASYKTRTRALALTTQRSTVVNLDKQGTPLRPAIVWLDQRRTENLPPMGGLWNAIFKISGLSDTIEYLRAEAEANWIRTHQPEIWDKTYKYLFLSGYLNYRLTGEYIDSTGSQVGYMPFNYKKHKWSGRFDWKWQAIPMRKELLPRLAAPGEVMGKISSSVAEETGLPAGLPVIAAAADKACEVIGSGCLEPHVGCLSYGTTATINTVRKKYIEVIPLIPPYPAAIPKAYNLEIQIYRGFWMVSWFKEQFAFYEQNIAKEKGIAVEELFDDLVNQVAPGSDGLILQPYWSPGLRHPGPEARGAIIGFGDVHTRAHLYRAILEGIAYGLREGAERIGKRSGVPVTELRVAGGGSQSDAAMQITADIFNLPAQRPHVYEASGLGAAIDAAVGSGLHSDFDSAIKAMTHPGDRFEPNPANVEIYDQIYRRVYQKMYGRLKDFYKEIKRIISS